MATKTTKPQQPLVSVIVPVYNVENYLERCIGSILAQTYTHLEILLIDDGSTDSSPLICERYSKKYNNVHVFHQKNQGLSAARNFGIRQSHGSFLTFVDSDDAVHPMLVTELLRLCQRDGTLISVCPRQRFTEHQSLPLNLSKDSRQAILASSDFLVRMLREQEFSVTANGKLYAKELFRHIEYPVGRLYEDIGTTYRLIIAAAEVSITNQAYYFYYQNRNSITNRAFSPQKEDLIFLTDQMCDNIDKWMLSQPLTKQNNDLRNILRERRMRARFSIIRQTLLLPPNQKTLTIKKIEKKCMTYLKQHSQDIFTNPMSSLSDRIALRCLLISPHLFRVAWHFYSTLRGRFC